LPTIYTPGDTISTNGLQFLVLSDYLQYLQPNGQY